MSDAEASVAGHTLLNRNDAVLAHLAIDAGDELADSLVVIGRDSSYATQVLLGKPAAANVDVRYDTLGKLNELAQHIRLVGIVESSETTLNQSLSQNNARSSTVASLTSRPVSSLLHNAYRQVLDRVKQVHRLSHSNTVLGNRNAVGVVRAFNQYSLAAGTKGALNSSRQLLDAANKFVAFEVKVFRYFIHSLTKIP